MSKKQDQKEGIFTDEMARSIFIFPEPMNKNTVHKTNPVYDTFSRNDAKINSRKAYHGA